MVFCISVLVGCWRGGSAFWYWGASLIPQLEIELEKHVEKHDGNFLNKKGYFLSCAVAVRVAPVVTAVAERIYILIETYTKRGDCLSFKISLYLFVVLGHTVVVKFKSITSVIWMGELCSCLCNLF